MTDPELVKRHKHLTMFQLILNAAICAMSMLGLLAMCVGAPPIVTVLLLTGCLIASCLHCTTFTGYD